MTKTERIIAAYNCFNDKWPDKRCENCPYGYGYLDQTGDNYVVTCNTEMIMADAIALLKAQEPRLLSVADIVDNYIAPEVIWVEVRNNQGSTCITAGLWNGEYYNMADDSVMYDLGEEIANNPDMYNSRWRVWTSRPTEEQREAKPWEKS